MTSVKVPYIHTSGVSHIDLLCPQLYRWLRRQSQVRVGPLAARTRRVRKGRAASLAIRRRSHPLGHPAGARCRSGRPGPTPGSAHRGSTQRHHRRGRSVWQHADRPIRNRSLNGVKICPSRLRSPLHVHNHPLHSMAITDTARDTPGRGHPAGWRLHSRAVALRAPSAMAWNFAQTTVGWTSGL